MSDVKDDPKEVLEFLNSLGFIGITATQLKSFMKELKLYRKIKEREQEEWKDKIRKEILNKQQWSLNRILQERMYKTNFKESKRLSSESSQSQEDSLVKIKIRCSSKDKENHLRGHSNQERKIFKSVKDDCEKYINCNKKYSKSDYLRYEIDVSKDFSGLDLDNDKNPRVTEKIKITKTDLEKDQIVEPKHSTNVLETSKKISLPKVKSAGLDSVRTLDTDRNSRRSKSSKEYSKFKSFIRPWHLQAESQQPHICKKSDPVALYHKYQQQWKQLSLPGEERHAKIRWEVREKMLGCNPNPRPSLRKTSSTSNLKRR